ncbi:MAG: hypothetical protein CMN31_23810, partial [Sandaracinus sp.]|nr:hypothetical protein [Sandaracinus sp.]
GELASHSRKLEAIGKRGRALRAEIGRKVEELAGEESRATRDALAERERAARIGALRSQAERELAQARQAVQGRATAEGYQALGAAQAKMDTLAQVMGDYERRAREREQYAASLRKQIDELKAQLQRYSEALENDLQAGRDRIATRVREALGYEKSFMDASAVLLEHLSARPESRELLEDIAKQMAEERAAQGHHSSGGKTG